MVDGGHCTIADFGQMFNDRICRGFVADFAQNRLHSFEERVDLAGRVAHNAIGQTGQQTKILCRAIELAKLPLVALRMSGLLEQRAKHAQHVFVQFAR